MDMLELNDRASSNIEIMHMETIGAIAYEIINCDSTYMNYMIICPNQLHKTQRAVELQMTDDEGNPIIVRYSRGSHKESILFRQKYNIDKFVYNKKSSLIYNITTKTLVFAVSNKWLKRLKMLEKAYKICFPDEICGDDINLKHLEKEFMQKIKSTNLSIAKHNINLMKKYRRIESNILSNTTEKYYLGEDSLLVELKYNSISGGTNRYILRWSSKNYLESFVGKGMIYNICSLYKEKETGRLISIILAFYENDKGYGRVAYWKLDDDDKFDSDDKFDKKCIIKVAILRHRKEDILPVKEDMPYNKYIDTFDSRRINNIAVYRLEDTPVVFRNEVMEMLNIYLYRFDIADLFDFKYINKLISEGVYKISEDVASEYNVKPGTYESLYNKDCMTTVNYSESINFAHQDCIVNTFGYGSN